MLILFFTLNSYPDSYKYNSYNNHGVVGLINTPTARLYDESIHGITIFKGSPDQKITLTSSPYNWMEASFFYTNIPSRPYCYIDQDFCKQGYKDKGFNVKFRVKEEGVFPAIAFGINDIAGTGFYSSEYIVASYGLNKIDLHFGIGWGTLNGSKNKFKNPLGIFNEKFYTRPVNIEDRGGQFQLSRYFSDQDASPFFGISYAPNSKLILKIENDTTKTPGRVRYAEPRKQVSFGIEYQLSDNISIGFANERGNYDSLKFIYKNNPKKKSLEYSYKKPKFDNKDNNYTKLIKAIEENSIGVNRIIETSDFIGLEVTQFAHPNLDIIEKIIKTASYDAGINKEIKTNYVIANLQGVSEFSSEYDRNFKLIYQRNAKSRFNSKTNLSLRPFLASREGFFKGSIDLVNNSEFILRDNFFFTTNIKYTLFDNYEDLTLPAVFSYPAQVRSDVKDYLKNSNQSIHIGRAQFDYHHSLINNHHIMFTAGILEDMYTGLGFEYLYFNPNLNYAVGFEVFDVIKRDYKMRFGQLDYRNIVHSANFYYRNYKIIPFDAKASYGEYLAGDEGITIELSRTFSNGTEFGVFASFTDVSSEQFGEGTFDKGIFFNIPVYGNFIDYTWRPLTKDPGAKLNRKHTLHDLLIKFVPFND